MKCKKCKVELAPYLDKCPLCNEKVTKQSDLTVVKLKTFQQELM